MTDSRDYRRLQSCPFIKMYDEFQIYVLVHGDDFYIIRDQKGISNAKEHLGDALRLKYTALFGWRDLASRRRKRSQQVLQSDVSCIGERSRPPSCRGSATQNEMEHADGCTVPGSRSTVETSHHELFEPDEARRFRSVCGRLVYLSLN